MTDIRSCFAYNQQKQRCDMPAGHPGNHAISIEWGDDECYDPTAFVDLPPLKTYSMGGVDGGVMHPVLINNTGAIGLPGDPLPPLAAVPDPVEDDETLGPVPVYGQTRPGSCVMCEHRMHVGPCERGQCDCRTGIPG